MSGLHNLIYTFSAIPIKIPTSYFVDIDKLTLMERQKIQRVNTVLKEKDNVEELTLPNFKTYDKATVIKTIWYWQKKRQKNQWDRIQKPYKTHMNIVYLSLT